MLNNKIVTYEDIIMLGKVFREHDINIIFGESGSGKTISTIKALNEDNIIPLLLDYDHNDSPETNGCEYIHIDGTKWNKDKNASIPSGYVIIVDTWQMFLTNGGSLDILNKIVKEGNTVILIAHNKPIATKQDIPDIDHKYVNHFGSKLFLERNISKNKGTYTISYNLHVKKCRGYKGEPIIKNWMREPTKSEELLDKVIK